MVMLKTKKNAAGTAQIEVLRDTICGGKGVKAGSIVTASARDATYLIATKRAVLYVEKKAEPKKTMAKKSPVNKAISAEELERR